jgi:LPS-assembly lipoprotein
LNALTAVLRSWLVLVALLVSGCGFHLRGNIVLPEGMQALSVKAVDPLNPLKLVLEQKLRSSKIFDADATSSIEILGDELVRETLSVNDRARVSEFELQYRISFRINQDQTEGATQNLEVRREYSFDEAQALGAAQEEAILTEELRGELADMVLARLQRGN